LTALRDMGFGKNLSEESILDEAIDLCKRIEQHNGIAVNIRNDFNISILNTLWKMINGERLPPESPKIQHLVQVVDDILTRSGKPSFAFLATITWLARLAIKLFPNWGWVSCYRELKEMCEEIIKDSITTMTNGENHTYLHLHLQEMERHNELFEGGSEDISKFFVGERGRTNLTTVITDFFYCWV